MLLELLTTGCHHYEVPFALSLPVPARCDTYFCWVPSEHH